MSRGGRARESEEPERRCIVSGETAPKAGLIRFVIGPDGAVVPDILARLPGRGLYVAADPEALAEAVAKNRFSRAARQPVTVPQGLAGEVERQLAARVVALVSMARKAGEAVCGFEKVRDALAKGQARVLLQASDGSARGKSKLWTPTGGRWFGCLTGSELGAAFGRDNVIHAALAAGGLAQRVIEDAARLAGLRAKAPVSGFSVGDAAEAGKD